MFNQFGDVERCALTPGNVHSADGWRAVLEPVIARYRRIMKRLYFRGDAAFGNPETLYAGKRLCVSGVITDYRGRPQIVVRDPSQINLSQ